LQLVGSQSPLVQRFQRACFLQLMAIYYRQLLQRSTLVTP